MNYHLTGDPAEVVKLLEAGDIGPLVAKDELQDDLSKQLCFAGFQEPDRGWPDFFPTYKKFEGRSSPQYSSAEWVRQQYRIDYQVLVTSILRHFLYPLRRFQFSIVSPSRALIYQDYWYKGGGMKLRMPSWCDRILYRSMPHLAGRLVPATTVVRVADCPGNPTAYLHGMRALEHPDDATTGSVAGSGDGVDWYRAVNHALRVSDHSPVCGVFVLQPEIRRQDSVSQGGSGVATILRGGGGRLLELQLIDLRVNGEQPKSYRAIFPVPFEGTTTLEESAQSKVTCEGPKTVMSLPFRLPAGEDLVPSLRHTLCVRVKQHNGQELVASLCIPILLALEGQWPLGRVSVNTLWTNKSAAGVIAEGEVLDTDIVLRDPAA
eukprot:SAG31_NODE_4156_length_3525_cov_2.014011_2_plen_377_part_00